MTDDTGNEMMDIKLRRTDRTRSKKRGTKINAKALGRESMIKKNRRYGGRWKVME